MTQVYATPGKLGTLVYAHQHALLYYERGTPISAPGYFDLEQFKNAAKAVALLNGLDVRKARLGQELERLRHGQQFHLAVIPLSDCGMSCPYCYARESRQTEQRGYLDPDLIAKFLRESKGLVGSITVYGGEPFLYAGLPKLMRENFERAITFSSGLGFSESEFNRLLDEAVKWKIGFSMSIDPPPEPGKPYSRVYAPYGPGWYQELLRRAGLVAKRAKFGVRCTVSDSCIDFRALRTALSQATGLPYADVPSKVEPASECAHNQASVDKCFKLLEQDAEDVSAGRLKLEHSPFKGIIEVLDPNQNFSQGGCFAPRNLALSYKGKLSFCSRSGTWPGDGLFQFNSVKEYADVVESALSREKCLGCLQEFACGTHCHAVMTHVDQKDFSCLFQVRRAELALGVAAMGDGIENVNKLLDMRITNMRRWASNADPSELASHVKSIQQQIDMLQKRVQPH